VYLFLIALTSSSNEATFLSFGAAEAESEVYELGISSLLVFYSSTKKKIPKIFANVSTLKLLSSMHFTQNLPIS